eukprot:3711056-Prymnesium_polylepis.1
MATWHNCSSYKYSGYSSYSRATVTPSDHASTHGATVPATVQLQRSYSALQQLQCSAGALTAARRRADPALLPKVVSVRE